MWGEPVVPPFLVVFSLPVIPACAGMTKGVGMMMGVGVAQVLEMRGGAGLI